MLTTSQYASPHQNQKSLSGGPDTETLLIVEQTHSPGQERILLNWDRRPTTSQHDIVEVVADLQISNASYPDILRVGGNTGTTDSFTGVDLQDLTGGVFNSEAFFDDNNAACFLYQATLVAMLRDVTTTPVHMYWERLTGNL